jgi:UDP-N-acetylglucosamine 2-epimerase
MFGIVVNTASDMKMEDDLVEEGDVEDHISNSDHIKGDIFAIFGAILLGLDDVLSEMIMDYGGVTEM